MLPSSRSTRHRKTWILVWFIVAVCRPIAAQQPPDSHPFLIVLGTAQDGGFPQAGCRRPCCQLAIREPARRRMVTSLAVVDPRSRQRWLIDCTPHFPAQLRLLDTALDPAPDGVLLNGIFLTHAHFGHYTGLLHLGREVMGARNVAVYAMPRMTEFLRTQGPWSLLVTLHNIQLKPLRAEQPVRLGERIKMTPLLVPHRDEFSETVGFLIEGPTRSVVFVPDIDKWERWNRRIEKFIVESDRAYLDGTFYDGNELPNRDLSQIPHPLIVESIQRFARLADEQRDKIHMIHLNHTNPAMSVTSQAARTIRAAGMHLAQQGSRYRL
ncbi:MAG: pyrroloquinoline quinone biosynthesis protein PqqB [Planctomycetaceae bacterium]|nr:pyrroloquinoline quinone biosynthesis protein PqqB [Planctomycetaceae bacterium]